MIRAEDVSVILDGHRVVDGVSLDVSEGEWVTLVGANGAGKTTFLRAVCGLVRAAGRVLVGGDEVARLRRRELARRLAVVPQAPVVPHGMSVSEYVLLGRSPYVSYAGRESRRDLAVARAALQRLDLTGFAERELASLSGGERQRAILARALAQEARVLVLDEPTTALDAGRQQQVLELVDDLRVEHGLTVLSAMHDLTLAGQYAERVVLLARGRVAAEGDPAEVLTAETIAEHYGALVRIHEGAVIPVRR
ncbi:MAG TPA: ABC transporter ATP-binding protein [Gaiellaceae bacterium]|nr:ABC transporter ATP-binding protein [Gaiellaceae bacterium]